MEYDMTKIKNLNIKIVNIKKNPEIKKEESYIYCGRGSELGNPFAMKNYTKEERDRVCEEYEAYIKEELKNNNIKIREALNKIWNTSKKHGHVELGCYCAPQRCHCDTIKTILENKLTELKKQKKINKGYKYASK